MYKVELREVEEGESREAPAKEARWTKHELTLACHTSVGQLFRPKTLRGTLAVSLRPPQHLAETLARCPEERQAGGTSA